MLGIRDGRARIAPVHPLSGARMRHLRLFHAIPAAALPAVLRDGLAPAPVALTPAVAVPAVWFTGDAATCAALGACDLGATARAALGFDPAAALRAPGAMPVLLAVDVPAADRRLVPWAALPPASLPALPALLAALGQRRRPAWFLYRGPVPAAWIAPLRQVAPLRAARGCAGIVPATSTVMQA